MFCAVLNSTLTISFLKSNVYYKLETHRILLNVQHLIIYAGNYINET